MRIYATVVLALLCSGALAGCKKEEQQEATATFDGFSKQERVIRRGLLPPARAPIHILVLGEGFSSTEEFSQGVIHVKQALVRLRGAVIDRSLFVRWKLVSKATGIRRSGDRCFFDRPGDAYRNIYSEKPDDFPVDRFVLVMNVGDGVGMAEGCSDGDVMFITSRTHSGTIAHELGHNLAGLYDESGTSPDTPPTTTVGNCSSVSPPHWHDRFATDPTTNCNGYARMYRPTTSCMMFDANSAFCAVCQREIECVFSLDPVADQCPVGTAFPSKLREGREKGVDVVAVVDAAGVHVLRAEEVRLDDVPGEAITGDAFAAIYDRERIVGVKSLSMPVSSGDERVPVRLRLTARAYDSDGQESMVVSDRRLIRFTVVGLTPAEVFRHELKLDLRLLNDARRTRFFDDDAYKQVPQNASPLAYPFR